MLVNRTNCSLLPEISAGSIWSYNAFFLWWMVTLCWEMSVGALVTNNFWIQFLWAKLHHYFPFWQLYLISLARSCMLGNWAWPIASYFIQSNHKKEKRIRYATNMIFNLFTRPSSGERGEKYKFHLWSYSHKLHQFDCLIKTVCIQTC